MFWNDYFNDNKEKSIFNLQVLKKKFTPYEMENKFVDEDVWETHGYYVMVQSIELPDKDVLIGFKGVIEDYDNCTYRFSSNGLEYYKLSEIRLWDISEQFYKDFPTFKDEEDDEYINLED